MTNCFGLHISLNCDLCDERFEFDVWCIVDTDERPDLLAKVKTGTLHDAVCPKCGYSTRIQSHVLLYRPSNKPVLLFSAAEAADFTDARSALDSLLSTLSTKLGDRWQEEWIMNGVTGVQRAQLASVICLGDKVFNNLTMPNERPLRLIQELIDAEQWDGTKGFILRNPSLLENEVMKLLDKIVSHTETTSDIQARALFDEYRQLLKRCREIGVEAAFDEKCDK